MPKKTSQQAGIEIDYDVWCLCGQWTYGGPTRAEAAHNAELSGWQFDGSHWICGRCIERAALEGEA